MSHLCRFCTNWADWDFVVSFTGIKVCVAVCGYHLGELKKKTPVELLNLIDRKGEAVNER